MDEISEPPSSPRPFPNMAGARKLIRKCERYCCMTFTYFPLAFVYSITTWAVWVEASIGFNPSQSPWIGLFFPEPSNHKSLIADARQGREPHFLVSPSTSFSTGPIPLPSSLLRVRLPIFIMAIPHSPPKQPPLRHPSPSNRRASSASVRSARHGSLTAPITARPATAAYLRWTTTVLGSRHALG